MESGSGVQHKSPRGPFLLPTWGKVCTWSFHSPNKPRPLGTGAVEDFLVTSTWLFEVFTYTHVVYQGDNLARGHLEVQSPAWSVLWTLSPPTQCLLDF